MYQFSKTADREIEIVLTGAVTAGEFKRITEQLQCCSSKTQVNILFDATNLLDHYTFKIFLDEHGFYRNNKSYVGRVAFVSDDESEAFLLEQFGHAFDMELKTFGQREEARQWIAH